MDGVNGVKTTSVTGSIPKAQPVQSAEAAPAAKAGDALKAGEHPSKAALATIDAATRLSPMPRAFWFIGAGAQRAWVQQGLAALSKGQEALAVLEAARLDGPAEERRYQEAKAKLEGAAKTLRGASAYAEEAPKAFEGLVRAEQIKIRAAHHVISAPPADKSGLEAWSASAREKLAVARGAAEALEELDRMYGAFPGPRPPAMATIQAFERRLEEAETRLRTPGAKFFDALRGAIYLGGQVAEAIQHEQQRGPRR